MSETATGGGEAQLRRAEISASALGMVLFLSSEVMFFAALFGAYFTIRAGAVGWPPEGVEFEPLLPGLATVVLVASSATVHLTQAAAERGNRPATSRWLLVTIAMGAVFLAAQIYEYTQLDFSLADHAYGTLFYSMTGFHGLHVLAGVFALVLVWSKNARGHISSTRSGPVIAVALYWHFVDIVWVLLFATLYLLK